MGGANNGVGGAINGISRANDGVSRANDGVSRANDGVSRANDGVSRANDGVSRANDGVSRANDGVSRANDGVSRANDGVSRANDGVSRAILVGVTRWRDELGGNGSRAHSIADSGRHHYLSLGLVEQFVLHDHFVDDTEHFVHHALGTDGGVIRVTSELDDVAYFRVFAETLLDKLTYAGLEVVDGALHAVGCTG